MKLKAIGVIIIILVIGLIAPKIILKFIPREKTDGPHSCIQILATGCYKNIPFLCETFPSPCEVPDNWK